MSRRDNPVKWNGSKICNTVKYVAKANKTCNAVKYIAKAKYFRLSDDLETCTQDILTNVLLTSRRSIFNKRGIWQICPWGEIF